MHVFLWGYMGCGKSTIGKKIATMLNCDFIDTDKLIEANENKTIDAIFETHGEEYFRSLEHLAIVEITKIKKNVVVATGGGLPCYNNNHQLMNESGCSVYIKLSAAALSHRITHSKIQRPLLKNLTEEDLLPHIAKQLQEREKYYNTAKIIYDGIDVKILELANIIKLNIG